MKRSKDLYVILILPLLILTAPLWILRDLVFYLSKLEQPLDNALERIGEVCRVEEFHDWCTDYNSIENQQERERIANEDL